MEEKGPILRPGASGMGPKWQSDHTASFALHVGEALERLSSLSDIVGPIPLSRIDPAYGLFVSARDLFLGAKQVRRAMVHTSGQQKWISALALGAPGSNASPSRGLSYPG